jgi:hypothetical protein
VCEIKKYKYCSQTHKNKVSLKSAANHYRNGTIEWLFKFILKVGVEKSIVNAPRITDDGSAV